MPVEQRHDTSNGSLPYLLSPVSDNANKPATLVLFLHGARDSLRDASRTRDGSECATEMGSTSFRGFIRLVILCLRGTPDSSGTNLGRASR
ncbi:hypothetical protein [Nostoc sp.]|uniref:hypothetical protein n=1 Tax=Nostoc sp. TaxID=1180 RepID=UPI002FF58722